MRKRLKKTGKSSLEKNKDLREIYIIGEIDSEMAASFILDLRRMDSSKGNIHILISTPGGCEVSGFLIYEAIRLAKNNIDMSGYAELQSIGPFIMQAARKRYLSPECRVMIHNGTWSIQETEVKTAVSLISESILSLKKYYAVLAERTKVSAKDIKDLCENESYFSAREAVSLGLADSVLDYKKAPKKASKKAPKKKKKK